MKAPESPSLFAPFKWRHAVFYGWGLVVITIFLNAVTGSPVFGGVGVWVDALEQHFGWSRAELSLAFSLGQLESGLAGPVVGILVDKYGPKKIVFSGVTIIGLGFILFSQTNTLLVFYASYIVIMLGASAGGWLPMMSVINNWFDKNRTMAMGLGGIGFSMGSFLLVPLLAWLVQPDGIGWRTTSMSLGIFFILLAYPISTLIRNTPEEFGEIPDGIKAVEKEKGKRTRNFAMKVDNEFPMMTIIKMPVFWILAICNGMSTMLIGTMTVHLILALKDQGIAVQTGAWIWGSTMLFSGAAQIFGGYLGDKVPKNISLCVFGIIQALGVMYSTSITTVLMAPIFVVVYGLGFGARIPLGTAIRGEYFGRKAFGKVLGVSMLPMMILMTLGPYVAGLMYDHYGSYDRAFYYLAIVSLIGSIGFLFCKNPNVDKKTKESSLGLSKD